MVRRLLCLVAVGASLALAACSDSTPQATTEPQFANTPPDACGFSTTLINNYFEGQAAQVIRSLKQTSGHAAFPALELGGAKNPGFCLDWASLYKFIAA